MADRTVHASIDGGGIEIVRYDRAGKWYIEIAADYGRPGLPAERFHVGVREAASRAHALRERGGVVNFGLPGGRSFDIMVKTHLKEQ